MRHKATKIGLTSLVLALAFGGLLYSTLSEGTEYYKLVEEVMVEPARWEGRNLQLHGFVVPNSIARKSDSLEWRFKVQSRDRAHVVNATYTGVVPDTFKDEAEVVLKGRLHGDGFQVAPNGVMAKCPSKYEEQSAAASATAGTE